MKKTALTVRQAAERLGISPVLVSGLCAAGKIRHARHGLGRGSVHS
jgi:excisionase family DNA binding protein